MTTREKIILEAEDRASREFDKATGGFQRMDRTMRKLALSGGIAIAGAAAARMGGRMVQMAVDAEEAESAFKTAFGDALPDASRFVDEFASKAGFATHELQQLLAITGSVVQGIGATEAESADLSEQMAILAGDVASFSNAQGGAEAVLLALQSAINGEREALKTYGLALSEAEVQSQALNDTGKERADELTRLEKAQATVTLAYEKAGKAIGDLDRTQDSSANTLRRVQAGFREAGTEIGKSLMPSLEELLPIIEDLVPEAERAGTAIANFFASFSGAAGAGLGGIPDLIDGISVAFNSVKTVGAEAGVILGEVFSLGFADTSGLQEAGAASARMNDVIAAARDLNAQIAEGRPTADAFADGLVHVARQSDLSDEAIGRLGASLGATTEEQRAALEAVLEFADDNNWRPENVDALSMALAELNMESPPAAFNLTDAEQAARDFFNTAAAGPPVLEELTDEMPKAAQAILEMIPAAEEAAAAFRDELLESATDFITGFEELPDQVDTTMDEFETNLTDRVAAQTEFWDGLATLAESGFGHLAEEIRAQGPSAAGLLEELTGDMERAAELDDMISAAGDQMDDVTGEYATALEENSDPTLTALGQFGLDMIDSIAAGIESGDLSGPLLRHIEAEVAKVTGNTSLGKTTPSTGGRTPGRGGVFQEGTWEVPGSGPIGAIVHGGETIFGPPGTSGRAGMVRDLASELGRVLGDGGRSDRPTVHIEQILVTVPAGTTISEALSAGAAEAAIEAVLS